ncbi:hypothetical protein M422DRAFT_140618, partial [Sphaerobolus stellatus SS14]
GHSLLMDEINLKECGRYLPSSNSIAGLCREHSHTVNEQVTSINAAIQQGLCHLVKKATVCAIGPFARDKYHISPILISPTCKMETAEGCKVWILMILDQWAKHADGEAKCGPIWSVAIDGNATHRKTFHLMLISETIKPGEALKLFNL